MNVSGLVVLLVNVGACVSDAVVGLVVLPVNAAALVVVAVVGGTEVPEALEVIAAADAGCAARPAPLDAGA